jgi:hypothetical protein
MTTTSAQILANQANAQNSTGPKTEEGKAASRLNALKHGMTSSMVVLPNEDPAEWESFRSTMLGSLRPHGEQEQILAVSIAEHKWRIRRLSRIETALLEQRMKAVAQNDPNLKDGYAALAHLFIDPQEQKRLSLLLRYMSFAERAHKKAMDELKALQMARLEQMRMERMRDRAKAAAASANSQPRNEAKLPPPLFSMDPKDLALRL